MPKFNLPDPADSQFQAKVVSLLKDVIDSSESPTMTLPPVKQPQDGLQLGSIWFDESDGKLKINTSAGVKTVKFE